MASNCEITWGSRIRVNRSTSFPFHFAGSKNMRSAGRIGCGRTLSSRCGEKDQFNLLYGARRFVRRLNEFGIAHRYEEFPDNHSGVDYRTDESLPFLAQALSG